jgi:pyruvate dehydrogenase E2 component (dihydrolipoamide acetyltransferase)
MKTVEMPKMGDTMEEGKILRWIKHEGDAVKKGESLAEVETDKVNIEIEAFASGVLRKILVPEGDSAPIGSGIALIGAADEPLPEGLAASAGERANGKTAASLVANMPIPAPTTQSTQLSPAAQNSTTVVKDAPAAYDADAQGRIFISPVARRLAEERTIDYSHIRGTGPNGRIIKLDVETALAQTQAVPMETRAAQAVPTETETETRAAQAPPPSTTATPAPTYIPVGEPMPIAIDADEVVEIPLTAMRRTIARRLSQSMQTAPHFYVTSVIDTGKLGELRKQINTYAASDPSPVKVSFNDLIIKAVARSLVKMPQVNVSFAEDKLLQKKSVHIGMAVALEQGLIVPVIHNADRISILDIARESQRLAEAARTGKLRPEEFSGGTFTVSNLGMFDVESFTAVINPPESAILAIGSITPTPVVSDGQVVVRDRMKVTLSSDHRAIDGATAARFLQEVKRLLEEPFGLLL